MNSFDKAENDLSCAELLQFHLNHHNIQSTLLKLSKLYKTHFEFLSFQDMLGPYTIVPRYRAKLMCQSIVYTSMGKVQHKFHKALIWLDNHPERHFVYLWNFKKHISKRVVNNIIEEVINDKKETIQSVSEC